MERETPVKTTSYEVCINGCMLYQKDDTSTVQCQNVDCKEPRFSTEGSLRREMKMLPIGQQMASMLANSATRELMKYRHNYNPVAGIYQDYFDGSAYKELVRQGFFDGEDDIALAMFVDGFTSTKSSQSSKLNIVHFINLNLPPEVRYQENYTFQVAVLPGPNNPKSLLDTFLRPIIEELKILSTAGMVVSVDNTEVCKAKVHLVMATGDLPASTDLAHHMTFAAKYGCRICQTETTKVGNHTCFLDDPFRVSVRPKSQFVKPSAENNLGIRSTPIFCELLSFDGPAFFGLDEMHLLGQGLGKTMYDLVTISLGKSYNSAMKLVGDDPKLSPFYIEKNILVKIGQQIERSKTTVPVSFNSKWVDPIKNSGGNRAVDYFNFLLYQLPTSFVPFFQNKRSRKPVLNLVKACQLCLQWSITTEELALIKKYFEAWVYFLKQQIEKKRIGSGVLKPTQHYLLHIEYMIQQNGPLKAFSARSMERAIGRYKKLIKSKSNVGANAGNVLVRLANRSFVKNLPWSIVDATNLLLSQPYSDGSYRNHPSNTSQLWEPFYEYPLSALPFEIDSHKMIKALKLFYMRSISTINNQSSITPDTIFVAGRAWYSNKVYQSRLYADEINEYRRGNCFVMLHAMHRK